MINTIVICGLISYESPFYWKLCYECINSTKSNEAEIRYLIGLDRISSKNVSLLKKCLPGVKLHEVSLKPPKGRKETLAEKRIRIGQLYNNLFNCISSNNEYVCVMDGDIAFVKKGWDKILLRELVNNYIIIGAEYGPRWPNKFQGFPNLSFSLMKWPIIKQLNIDCCGCGKSMIISRKESGIFGLKEGSKLNCEIGWRFPREIRNAGYDGKCMQVISGNSKKAQIINPINDKEKHIYIMNKKTNIKSLFEIHWKNEAIATHLTKSTCLAFNEHPISKYWITKVKNKVGI